MLRAGVGLSTERDPARAVEEAVAAALGSWDAADFAIVFATLSDPLGTTELLERASAALGTGEIVGASAHGIVAGDREWESSPGVAVMALRGIAAQPFLLSDLRGHESHAGSEIAARLGGPPRPEDLVVVLPDPHLDSTELASELGRSLAPARVVGAGSGGPLADAVLQWYGARIESGALAGIVLRGSRPARVGVTQACRPVSEMWTVTRTRGNWILELDGRPALDVYREAALGPLADDLARAAAFVLVALPRDASAPLRPGGYLVRHVVGFSPEDRAFAIPEIARRGDSIAFALREPASARSDLQAMLEGVGSEPAQLGLYFNCCARGAAFFGVEGLEAAYIARAQPDTPLLGMFGSCEVGPIGNPERTELLTYTGVLALVD